MVNLPTPGAAAGADPWAILEGGGGVPAVKFGERNTYGQFIPAPIGTSYTGTLVANLGSSQITNYETKEAEFWPNGDPKMQILADIQTDARDDEDDDGIRRIYFKGQMRTALEQEIREKKTGRFGVGTRITVTLVDLKAPKTVGYNPQNIFRVDLGPEIFPYVADAQVSVDNALGGATAETQAPVAQPAAAVAATPAPAATVDVAAVLAAAQSQAAQSLPLVTEEDLTNVKTLTGVGLPLDQAIAAYAEQTKRGADFVTALTAAVSAQ